MKKYMITTLVLLLFLSTSVYAKKVKEVAGLKVPKGITAIYDDLDNTVTASDKYSKTALMYSWRYPAFFMRIKYNLDNNTAQPEFELNLHTTRGTANSFFKLETFIDVSSFEVFVRGNDGTKRYKSDWAAKQITDEEMSTQGAFGGKSTTWTREWGFVNDIALATFLLENLNAKSEVILRFYNAQGTDIQVKLSKGDVKKLFNTIKFYDQLTDLKAE